MARPSTSGDHAAFLTELRGFFETCDARVDQALAAHFGFDTAVDWITVWLELLTEHLQTPPDQPSSANFQRTPRD